METESISRRRFIKSSTATMILTTMGGGLISNRALSSDWLGDSGWEGCLHYLEETFPTDIQARQDFNDERNQSYTCLEAAEEFARNCELGGKTMEQVAAAIEDMCCGA